ncbi:hypothetical protein BDW74DRAFT_183557 [Aspergillus multicolor]|uniref:uncharacterized protein n=1 Tax=Aspergillus multicolor TaxID=41759 RepID=UPI003CCCE972
MKLSTSLCALLASTSLVAAAPAPSPNDLGAHVPSHVLDIRTLNEADEALALLEKRRIPSTCRTLGRLIWRIGTSQAINVAVNEFADMAIEACGDIQNDNSATKCAKYVRFVRRGLNIVFLVAPTYSKGSVGETPGSADEQSSWQPGTARRDLAAASGNGTAAVTTELTQSMGAALREYGFAFDGLDTVDVSASLAKRDGEPRLVSRIIARNMRGLGEDTDVYDVGFNAYDNGAMDLDLAGDFKTLSSASGSGSDGLQKRMNGAGFKISVTTRKKSLLTKAHMNEMANKIASDWAYSTYHYHASDYIGLVKTDHTANFYFRIIPETKGFGLNYEDVNFCGGMAKYL